MKNLSTKVQQALKLPSQHPPQNVPNTDESISLRLINEQVNQLHPIKSIHELLTLLPQFEYQIPEDIEDHPVLVCTPCRECTGDKLLSRNITIHSLLLQNSADKEHKNKMKKQLKITKRSIIRHLQSNLHLQAIKSELERKQQEKISHRNEEIRMRCARIIHYNVFEARSYSSYERDISVQSKMNEIGQQQHSRKFAKAFTATMSDNISSKLNTLITTPLPCIGERNRPVSLSADKGTMKHLTLQPANIITPTLQNGHFTTEFFAGSPVLSSWNGKGIAQNMLNSVDKFGLSEDILSQSISGAVMDGEYLLKNVPEHIADQLGFQGITKENFLARSIWDPAHRLEKSDEHSVEKSPIIKQFNKRVKSHISHFRVGKQRVNLNKEAGMLDVKAYEPRISSDTRFVAHQHKVLCNQFSNWPVQYSYWEKRSQENNEGDNEFEDLSSSEIIESQKKASDLRNVRFITVFLSMLEITDVMTRASCLLQGCNRFPWEYIDVIKDLIKKLEYVKECFSQGTVPSISHSSYNDHKYTKNDLGKQPWAIMKDHLPSNSRDTFLKIPVVCSGEFDSRSIRKYLRKNAQKEVTIDSEVKEVLKEISSVYITQLINFVNGYFITGDNPSRIHTSIPKWIPLSKTCFNFNEELEIGERRDSFKELINNMIQQFTENEIEIACFQYTNLLKRASALKNNDKDQSKIDKSIKLKSIMYQLCTTPSLYTGCELALVVMLYNVCVAVSECGVESLISTMARSNTKERPISISVLENEVNIRKNGPHPLHKSTDKFLYDSLCRHFGGGPEKWNFLKCALGS